MTTASALMTSMLTLLRVGYGWLPEVRFLKTVQKAGLYANLRVEPYVCAKWNFGGFPVWLKYVPGISFRTDNEPFKMAMKGFTEKNVNLMKSEKILIHVMDSNMMTSPQIDPTNPQFGQKGGVDGLIRQPKYGHMKELHLAIKQCEKALIAADPIVTSLGSQQEGVQTSKMEILPSNIDINSWETYNEDISSMEDSSAFTTSGLLEQINGTRDASDYLWYITR
ncbi:hypothetical protein AgCh_027823 [Apium graveolens]